jgi:hypothetical protein
MKISNLIWIVAMFLLTLQIVSAVDYPDVTLADDFNQTLLLWETFNRTTENSTKDISPTIDNSVVTYLSSSEDAQCPFDSCMDVDTNSQNNVYDYGDLDIYDAKINFTVCGNLVLDDDNLNRQYAGEAGSPGGEADWGLLTNTEGAATTIIFNMKDTGGSNFISMTVSDTDTSDWVSGDYYALVCVSVNHTNGVYNAYLTFNDTEKTTGTSSASQAIVTYNDPFVIGSDASSGAGDGFTHPGKYADFCWWNSSLPTGVIFNDIFNSGNIQHCGVSVAGVPPLDTAPPEITSYNMTSEGGEGCTQWNTNKNNPCVTDDATPTVFIDTDEIATCAIGVSNLNYTDLTAIRECSGAGSLQHTCTIIADDELTEETSFVYIGCKDGDGNENLTSTSSSLKISIPSSDLEAKGRNFIESGIDHALPSGYTLYTDQRVYARNSANDQFTGIFDKVVKWMNKIWAINFLTGNDTELSIFNISPVLYTLELKNMTNSTINSTVYQFILDTK